MIKNYLLLDGKLQETHDSNSSVRVYINPNEDEKRYLLEVLKIDEHTLSSALDPDELSRVEFEPDHVAIIYKRPRNYSAEDKFLFKVLSTGIFLFKEMIVIVASEDLSLQANTKQLSKINNLNDLMLKLIYVSIFHFLEHLRIITMITDELEAKISRSLENKYLLNLFTLEKSLVYYLNSINSNEAVIGKLKSSVSKIGFTQEQIEFLEDIIIENQQCYKQAEIYSNILASLMDARVSVVSNNLNILMKKLNIITIAIMVPTFVVSTFSMNVKIPLQQNPLAFWIIMLLSLFSVIIFFLFWKYNE